MHFEYEYPLYVIYHHFASDGTGVAFHDLQVLEIPDGTRAVAVFTDKEGAEEFRDRNCPDNQLFVIPDAETFAGTLVSARSVALRVAFDPWKPGKALQAVRIDELL